MDCWVVQAGVATAEHLAVAAAGGLRVRDGRVALSSDEILRDREISPFIIDMENNGVLARAVASAPAKAMSSRCSPT